MRPRRALCTHSACLSGGAIPHAVPPARGRLDQPSYNPLRIVFDILGEEMPVGKYYGLGYWTPQGYWRFPVGNDAESVGGFRQTLRDHATDPELAIAQCAHAAQPNATCSP